MKLLLGTMLVLSRLNCLVQGLLLVGGDGAVRGGVGDAGQDEAVAHLGVIQEGLVGLVDGASHNLASAAGASTSAARVGQVQASLLQFVTRDNVSASQPPTPSRET